MPPLPWIDRVGRIVRRLRASRGARWVVAVSGGADSVALLRVLHGFDLGLTVAHLDHGARPEAAEDARFVSELADKLGLPFDLGRWQSARAAHFEADARAARYEWLAGVARSRGAEVVAVGHTRDDQAETILHRIVRGTGPRGLSGMARARPLDGGITLARPLLDVGRAELRAYLKGLPQDWREDATNADLDRTRARVRHELIPRLADDYNPDVVGAIVRLGALAGAGARALDGHVEERARAVVRTGPDGALTLDRPALVALSPFLRAEVLRRAWREAGWPERAMDARRWRRLAAWAARGSGPIDVGAGVRGEVVGDAAVLARPSRPSEPDRPAPVPLAIPGEAGWKGRRIIASLEEIPSSERLDLDRLVPPLVVDGPRPGDRFDPLGLEGRTTALADFLRGRRVPKAERERVPVVRDALGIVWVVGHRIGHRARVTDGTRRVVHLSCQDASP